MSRPLKFDSVQELQKRINAYFRKCDPHVSTVKELDYPTIVDEDGKEKKDYSAEPTLVKRKIITQQVPYTITGLALYLRTSRQTLLNYEEREEFFDTIKEAKLRCENYAELELYSGKPTGAIFNLKNNHDWKDAKQLDGTMKVRRSPYEDLSEEQLQSKISEAMQNLMKDENGVDGQ